MPDAAMEIELVRLSGTWREASLGGAGLLRLGVEALEIVPRAGPPLSEGYAVLSGAVFRTGSLALHGAAGTVHLEAPQGLDRAWVALIAHACPLPEFTRGLRALGSRRFGDAAAQGRFFAPLIQARRRMQEEADLHRRLDTFPGVALAERVTEAVEALARDCYPASGPDQRALEAELFDAVAPLLGRLGALEDSASRFRTAGEETRFDVWRSWVEAVTLVFAEADRGWSAVARLLPAMPASAAPGGRVRRFRGRAGEP